MLFFFHCYFLFFYITLFIYPGLSNDNDCYLVFTVQTSSSELFLRLLCAICAIFTPHRCSGIETAPLCKNVRAIRQIFMEILYLKDLGDTESVITHH